MDDYDFLSRWVRYAKIGVYLGFAAGVASSVYTAEQTGCNSLPARISLDVLVGIVGGVGGASIGFLCSWVAADLVSRIMQMKDYYSRK
jgi:hypothetical protein